MHNNEDWENLKQCLVIEEKDSKKSWNKVTILKVKLFQNLANFVLCIFKVQIRFLNQPIFISCLLYTR